MSALVDVLAGLAQERPVTIRDAVTTATAGSVMVGGAPVAVSRWVNRPEGAGQRVVLLLQGGTAVAVGAGLYRPDLDARFGVGTSAWGSIATTALPNATVTRLGLVVGSAYGGLTVVGNEIRTPTTSTPFGWWFVQVNFTTTVAVGAGVRAFVDIMAGTTNLGRSSLGVSEDRTQVSAITLVPAGQGIFFQAFQTSGATATAQPSGQWVIKHLGAHP